MEELKKAKETLELDIRNLLMQFEANHSVRVNHVYIARWNAENELASIIAKVKIEVVL